MKTLVLLLNIFSLVSFADDGKVDEKISQAIQQTMEKAKTDSVNQILIVTTGKSGTSFSYVVVDGGDLILLGGLEWAKTSFISDFNLRQKEKKK